MIVSILETDVFETRLTPVKYPLSEVMTEINGMLMPII